MQALAQHIMGRRAARQAADAEGPPLSLYVDCRSTDMGTPAELAKALRELVTDDPSIMDRVTQFLASTQFSASMGLVTGGSVDLKTTVQDMFKPHEDVTPVASAIASWTKFLRLFKGSRYKPLIFIDEANVLQAWKETDAGMPELVKLLRFLVKITKQDRLAQVVLATSSSFLEGFLRHRKCAAVHHPCR